MRSVSFRKDPPLRSIPRGDGISVIKADVSAALATVPLDLLG